MITLFDNFEGSSVNLKWSSATASEVLIAPAVQGSEVISDEKRWLRPTVGVREVKGLNGIISNVVVPVPVPTPAPVVVTPPPLPPATAQVFSGNFTVTINNDGTRTFTGTYR